MLNPRIFLIKQIYQQKTKKSPITIPKSIFSVFPTFFVQYLSHNYITKKMKLSRHIRYFLARRTDRSDFNYGEVAEAKFEYLKKYSKRYQSDQKFTHKEILYEEFIYGNSCHIAGTTAYSYASQGFAKSVMKMASPRLVVLGGISDNYLRYFESTFGIRHFYEHPMYRPERMICKERMSRYIQARLEGDHCFNWNQQKKEMIYINHQDRRIEPHDELTIAHLASLEHDMRIALGKPSDTVVLEDLIMRYSVEELQGIANRAIEKTRSRRSTEREWQLSYTREAIRNYVMSQEPQIFSKQLTYQAALLKRYAKISENTLMFVPGYFVKRIADQVHQIDVKPEQIFRDGLNDPNTEVYSLLQKTLKENDPQTILQKFALLMLIRQSWIESEFARGSNVFKHMCFGKLFENMSMDELFDRYKKAREVTQTKWFQLIHQRINNVHTQPGPHIKYTLAQQFNTLEERVTKSFPYTYQQKNYMSVHEDQVKMAMLTQKMRDHLNEEGDPHRIAVFDGFMKGDRTKEGILLFSKLLGKMNVQMEDRLKLPVFHYGAFRGIYKEYLRDFLLKGDQYSKIDAKIEQRKNKMEQLMQAHAKKLDDPLELQKYVTGQKGKAMHVSFDPEEGPNFGIDDIEHLQQVFGKMTPQDQQELREQYGDDWDKVEQQ